MKEKEYVTLVMKKENIVTKDKKIENSYAEESSWNKQYKDMIKENLSIKA